MADLDIKDFQAVSGISLTDYVLLSQSGGGNGKMLISLLKSALQNGIMPSIGQNGNWYIGDSDTGVRAEVKQLEFRSGELGLEYRYTGDEDWEIAITYEDILPAMRGKLYTVLSQGDYEEMIESGSGDPDMLYLTTGEDEA